VKVSSKLVIFFYELCKKTKVGVIFCIIVPCDAGAIYITTKGYIPSSHVTVPQNITGHMTLRRCVIWHRICSLHFVTIHRN